MIPTRIARYHISDRKVMRLLTFGLLLTLANGCQSGGAQHHASIDVPSKPGSAQPFLSAERDGTILMSWIQKIDTTNRALRYASFDGQDWSEPQTIVSDPDLFANWADVPKLHPLSDGRLVAHFGVNSGLNYFANDLFLARTSSSGEWQEAISLHDDGTPTQHGFASVVPIEDRLMAVWLDGRETTMVDGKYDESEWGNMALYAASFNADQELLPARLLDDRVCDCCPTAAVRTAGGALIAYRDRSDDETRDINLLRFDGDEWSKPYPLHNDGWIINGCPVNGPALAADGDRVVAAWFTAANDTPKVQVAFSGDGGAAFGAPIIVDDMRPRGRVGVLMLDDGSALVSWIGIENRQNALKVRRVDERDGLGDVSVIAIPKSPAFTGIPQLARSESDAFIAWVDGGHPDSTQIHLASLPVSQLK